MFKRLFSQFLIFLLLFSSSNWAGEESSFEALRSRLEGLCEVDSFLGEGSQATVFLGQLEDGQPVAIKYFHEVSDNLFGTTDVANSYLISEALKDLPHVSQVLDVVGEDILILELVKGETLDLRLEQGVEESVAERWLYEFFDTVESILLRNVLPFDIALDNMMVDEEHGIQIIDLAFFIELDQYLVQEAPITIFREGYFVKLGDRDWQVTPQLTTYLTAQDLLEITNSLLVAMGRCPLGEEYKPSPEILQLDARSFEDLQLLRQYLWDYLQSLRRFSSC